MQSLCGVLQILTIIPILLIILPEQNEKICIFLYKFFLKFLAAKFPMPKLSDFMNILKNTQMIWSLIFIMVTNDC